MPALASDTLTSFKVKNKEFVVIPKKEFLKLKRNYSQVEKKEEEYPKLYTEIDEEWTWETIDFWPKWVDTKELINYLKS